MANCPYYKELREGQARPVHCWLLEDTGHLGFRISNAESHWVEGSRMYESTMTSKLINSLWA